MTHRLYPHDIPDVFLILGIDASGKDYVANALEKIIREAGGEVEKRKRYFSGPVTQEVSSINKGFFDLLQETLFLSLYPYMGKALPYLIHKVLHLDIARYRAPDRKLIIVGHNVMRVLAFHFGHTERSAVAFDLPDYLREVFREVRERTRVHTIVLDVDPNVRQRRILRRARHGVTDRFDDYMLKNPARSERIEACLVRLAQDLLGAVVMENNDLHEEEIKAHVLEGIRSRTLPDPRLVSHHCG